MEDVNTYWFGYDMYEFARGFVEHLEHPDLGVVENLTDGSSEFDPINVVEAWWVMMLRGVAWDMAPVGRAEPGEAIPGYLCGSQTPVWIT